MGNLLLCPGDYNLMISLQSSPYQEELAGKHVQLYDQIKIEASYTSVQCQLNNFHGLLLFCIQV